MICVKTGLFEKLLRQKTMAQIQGFFRDRQRREFQASIDVFTVILSSAETIQYFRKSVPVTFAFAAALLRLYRASGMAGWRIFSNSWMQEDKVIYEFGICKIFGRKNLSHLPELLDTSAQIRGLRNISYFLIHFDLPGHEGPLQKINECILLLENV